MQNSLTHGLRAAAGAVALCLAMMTPVIAQTTQVILTVDSEALFVQSAFGKRVARDLEVSGQALEAENRQIEADLQDEEQDLTTRRSAMTPAAFRAVADAFDTKVQRVRSEQNAKARSLQQLADEQRGQFLGVAGGVLEALMIEVGATVVLDRRQVFLSARAIDITETAISRIDAAIGAGTIVPSPQAPLPTPETAPEAAPETAPETAPVPPSPSRE